MREFFPRAEISTCNEQETCSGVVNDGSPFSEVIESDEEMIQTGLKLFARRHPRMCIP